MKQTHADKPLPASETFPYPTSTVPFWRTQLHPLDSHRSTPELPEITDIAIIGAGMSGVSTAYHILRSCKPRPTRPSITILEARQLCSGATGRNGGHLKLAVPHITKVLASHGAEAAAEVGEFPLKQMDALKQVIDREGIDCDFLLTRSFDVFMDSCQAEEQEREVKALWDAGIDVVKKNVNIIKKEHVEAVTGVKGASGARSVPAASFWPYKFVTALTAKIIHHINLQTNTMVTSVTSQKDTYGLYTITTPRGPIKARKVIFASNAYTAGLLPSLEGIINPYKGINSRILREHPSQIDTLQTRIYTYNIFKDPNHVEYIIHRPDRSTIIGGAKATFEDDPECYMATVDDSTLIREPLPRLYFEGRLERYWQDWAISGASVDMIWTGIQGATPDGFSLIGNVPDRPDQHIIAGFNGAGMLFIFLSSEELARMIVDGVPFGLTGIPRIFESSRERWERLAGLVERGAGVEVAQCNPVF